MTSLQQEVGHLEICAHAEQMITCCTFANSSRFHLIDSKSSILHFDLSVSPSEMLEMACCVEDLGL